MWLLLKEGEPDKAWESLVRAQMLAASAARAHAGFAHLERHAQHLEDIERLIFPPQVFVSTGSIVKRQTCSICGSEYGECEHLAGRPYFGEVCAIVAGDLEINHAAVVKNPADKGCRITHFSVAGGERNRMTWKIEPTRHESNERNPEKPGLGARAVIRRAI
jgi:hypothetical protein